jgi:glyoxylate reductase
MTTIATMQLPGGALDALDEVEVVPLHELRTARPGVTALIGANERIDGDVLDLLPDLRIVANYSVGYDQIDVDACARRDVVVTNTPGVLDAATADLAFALLLAVRRRVVQGDRFVRAGRWQSGWHSGELGDDVAGSTVGIVGMGRIGTAVARRARGFDMRILYTRRHRLREDEERALGVEYRELDDLLRDSDSVSLHVPLVAETVALLDARRLALLRDGACVVNTARGDVVDQDALVRELVSGRLRAGLDVFVGEPEVPPELLELENVVLTPHVGSATASTRVAMARLAVENVLAVAAGRPPLTPVR